MFDLMYKGLAVTLVTLLLFGNLVPVFGDLGEEVTADAPVGNGNGNGDENGNGAVGGFLEPLDLTPRALINLAAAFLVLRLSYKVKKRLDFL